MKRLALVLAATVLGTGCIVTNDAGSSSPCVRTLTVDWSFRNYQNQLTSSCAVAGVDELDVYVNGSFVQTVSCSGPALVVNGIGLGTQSVRVDAVDVRNTLGLGPNRIAYRDELTVDTTACGDHAVVSEPAEAQVNLDYGVPSSEAQPDCSAGCTLYYQVTDRLTQNVAANYAQYYNPVAFPNDIILYLPLGDFSVDFVQIVSNASHLALKQACIPPKPTFAVVRPGTGVPAPQLAPAAASIPVKSSCP